MDTPATSPRTSHPRFSWKALLFVALLVPLLFPALGQAASTLWVLDQTANALVALDPSQGSAQAPLLTISGANTGLSTPVGFGVFPGAKEISVLNNGSGTVRTFSYAGSGGNIAPARTFTDANASPVTLSVAPASDEIMVMHTTYAYSYKRTDGTLLRTFTNCWSNNRGGLSYDPVKDRYFATGFDSNDNSIYFPRTQTGCIAPYSDLGIYLNTLGPYLINAVYYAAADETYILLQGGWVYVYSGSIPYNANPQQVVLRYFYTAGRQDIAIDQSTGELYLASAGNAIYVYDRPTGGGNLGTLGIKRTVSAAPALGNPYRILLSDPLGPAAPSLTSISPSSIAHLSPDTTISLTGSNFTVNSVAKLGSTSLATTFGSGTSLTAVVPAASLVSAGSGTITVYDSGTGRTSGGQTLTISSNNPVPVTTSVSPTTYALNQPVGVNTGIQVTITGTGFVPGASQAQWMDNAAWPYSPSPYSPVVVNAAGTQLTTYIPYILTQSGYAVKWRVVNPGPGGGTSNPVWGSIPNPTVGLTSISPSVAVIGSGNTQITLTGSNFVTGSGTYQSFTPTIVQVNGTTLSSTWNSATSMTATIPSSLLAAGGTLTVTALNPDIPAWDYSDNVAISSGFTPYGKTTASQTFTVNNAGPTLSSISPTTVVQGSGWTTVNATGTNFVNGASQIAVNGTLLTTTCTSSTACSASIPAVNFATLGTLQITVVNPAPGGGASGSKPLAVVTATPVLSGIAPTSIAHLSSATTITLNGSNFSGKSVARLNGADLATTYGSGGQLTAVVPAASLASAGTATITVYDSDAQASSGGQTLTITSNYPVPTISNITPNAAGPGAAGLVVTGTNFTAASGAYWNAQTWASVGGSTTIVSDTQITLGITFVPSGYTAQISVTNPGPGGGQSNAVTFGVTNPTVGLSSISPSSVPAGSDNQTITLTGSNFTQPSCWTAGCSQLPTIVTANGTTISSTWVSATSMTATIPSSMLTAAGSITIAAVNPDVPGFGGSTSATKPFTVQSAGPTLSGIAPGTIAHGSSSTTITLTGSSFTTSTVAQLSGTNLATTFANAGQITAIVPASSLASAGSATITIADATAQAVYGSQTLTISANNPAPSITSISPNHAAGGSTGNSFTLTGTNLIPTSNVTYNGQNWNNVAGTTTFVNDTTLNLTMDFVPAGYVAALTVVNAGPGGGTSNSVNFGVVNPTVGLTSIAPASATAGSGNQSITLTGSRFVHSGCWDTIDCSATPTIVTANGTTIASTWVGGTAMTAVIPSSMLASAGSITISAVNPDLSGFGGGTSASQTFTVVAPNPVPQALVLLPTPVNVGTGTQGFTIDGSGFYSGSVLTIGGTVVPVEIRDNGYRIAFTLDSTWFRYGQAYTAVVTNPAPGGGTSAPLTLTVNNLVPSISSLTPATAPAGSGDTLLTVSGGEFYTDNSGNALQTIQWNGTSLPTTLVNGTLQATIPENRLSSVGTASVTVVAPVPGGGTSNAATFTIGKQSQTITFAPLADRTYSNPSFALSATASSGLTVTFSASGTCTISNGIGYATGAGTCSITADQAGDATHLAAPSVTRSFQVTQASQSVTFAALADKTFGDPDFSVNASASSGLAATFAASGNCSVSGSTVHLTGAGSCSITASQAGDTNYLAAADVTRNFTIAKGTPVLSWTSPTPISLGTPLSGAQLNATASVPGSFVYIPVAGTILNAGSSQELAVTFQPDDQANYTSTTASVHITISNPVPTVSSVSPASIMAGAPDTTLTIQGDGFAPDALVTWNGATLNSSYVSPTQLTAVVPAVRLSTVGTATIRVSNPAPGGGLSAAQTCAVQAPLTVGSLTQAGGSVTVPVSWSSTPLSASVDCGTVPTQSVPGQSGTCTYTQPGSYTIQGSYVSGGTRVNAAPVTITVPAIAPIAAALRITSVDGVNNPVHDTTSGTPVVTMPTPTVYPIPLSLSAALVQPDGTTGVLQPLASANITSTPVSSVGAPLAGATTVPVTSQPTPTSTLSNVSVSNVVEDYSDPTTWRVKFHVTGTTTEGTQVQGDLVLQGPRGNGSTVSTTVQKVPPAYSYWPATYRYTLNGVTTPTTGEPYTRAWAVDENGTPLVAALQDNVLTVTFNSAGAKTIKLNVEGLFAGAKLAINDSLTVVDPPTPSALGFTVTYPTQNRPPSAIKLVPNYPPLGPGEKLVGSPAWTVDGVGAGSSSTLTYTFNTAGSHTVGATQQTTLPRTLTGSQTVTVNPNQLPVGTVSCSSSYISKTTTPWTYVLSCRATASDPDGTVKSLVWGIPSLNYSKAGTTSWSYTFPAASVVSYTLTITDNSGGVTVVPGSFDLGTLR